MIIAAIGSREITEEEKDLLFKTGAWGARRGIKFRSGGAEGADQAWIIGVASVNPELATVCLPAGDRKHLQKAPLGTNIQLPPYPQWLIDIAIAEYEFGEKLVDVGFSPYDSPVHQKKFIERKGWKYLETMESKKKTGWARQKNPDAPEVVIPENTSYVQELMIRNASIVMLSQDETVSAVMGLINPSKKGGGTGHAFRLAKALKIPTFNLRDVHDMEEARRFLTQARKVSL